MRRIFPAVCESNKSTNNDNDDITWDQNTFTALKLMPKWRVVLDATSVSAYLQSAESTEKCGMDADYNWRYQTRQHDELLLLSFVDNRAEMDAHNELDKGWDSRNTKLKRTCQNELTVTMKTREMYKHMTKNFGVVPDFVNSIAFCAVVRQN